MQHGPEQWLSFMKNSGGTMEFIEAKTLLRKVNFDPSFWFGIQYIMNLYKGCNHGCVYCDSRSDKYYIKDFDKVRGKNNIDNILNKELNRLSPGMVDIGAMSDTYNSFESKYELTKRALEAIDKHGFGISIATKSNLIIRDKLLLASIARNHSANIKMSITSCDDLLSKQLEPHASPTTKRMDAIRELSNAGIYTGVLITPVIPFITDTKENIETIISMAAANGAKFIYTKLGMTMRSGQREYFYHFLKDHYPELIQKYRNVYGYRYSCEALNIEELKDILISQCKKYGLKYEMNDIIKENKVKNQFQQLSLFDSSH